MNIVQIIAEMIEPPPTPWYDGTGYGAKPVKLSKITELEIEGRRLKAEGLAIDILNYLLNISHNLVRKDLIQFELDGWKQLGLPVDNKIFKEMVKRKYKDLI
jgi:hypothetical protein